MNSQTTISDLFGYVGAITMSQIAEFLEFMLIFYITVISGNIATSGFNATFQQRFLAGILIMGTVILSAPVNGLNRIETDLVMALVPLFIAWGANTIAITIWGK